VKASILLEIRIDEDFVASEALRRGKPASIIREEFIASLECDLNDVCRCRRGHGVESVVSRVHQLAQV
jgi:hypothetical protein